MENYFNKITFIKGKTRCSSSSTSAPDISTYVLPLQSTSNFTTLINIVDLDNVPLDPSKRPRILSYNVNRRDQIHRLYSLKRPCQPNDHKFRKTKIWNKFRGFVPTWFDQYVSFLEYSIENKKTFCLCCYLFIDHIGKQVRNDICYSRV